MKLLTVQLRSKKLASNEISATHVTFNESDASKAVTWRNIKSRNAHFRDNAHFSR